MSGAIRDPVAFLAHGDLVTRKLEFHGDADGAIAAVFEHLHMPNFVHIRPSADIGLSIGLMHAIRNL
jgi:hypothetical protein